MSRRFIVTNIPSDNLSLCLPCLLSSGDITSENESTVSGGHEKSSFFLLRPYLFRHDEGDSSRTKSIFLRQPSLVGRLPQSDVFILFYGLWHSRIKAVQLKNKQFYNYPPHCDVINIVKGLRHIKNTQSSGGFTVDLRTSAFTIRVPPSPSPSPPASSLHLTWLEPPLCWLSSQNIKEIPPPRLPPNFPRPPPPPLCYTMNSLGGEIK